MTSGVGVDVKVGNGVGVDVGVKGCITCGCSGEGVTVREGGGGVKVGGSVETRLGTAATGCEVGSGTMEAVQPVNSQTVVM